MFIYHAHVLIVEKYFLGQRISLDAQTGEQVNYHFHCMSVMVYTEKVRLSKN